MKQSKKIVNKSILLAALPLSMIFLPTAEGRDPGERGS